MLCSYILFTGCIWDSVYWAVSFTILLLFMSPTKPFMRSIVLFSLTFSFIYFIFKKKF